MTKIKALDEKPYAGNPHVRFDKGESRRQRRGYGSILYRKLIRLHGLIGIALCAGVVFASDSIAWTYDDSRRAADVTGTDSFTAQNGIETFGVEPCLSNDLYRFSTVPAFFWITIR